MGKNAVFVTRGRHKWYVAATSAWIVRYVCQEQGWEFDAIEEVPATDFTELFKKWGIGELVDKIGAQNKQIAVEAVKGEDDA